MSENLAHHDFLKISTTTAPAAQVQGPAHATGNTGLPNIALQLYTVRDELEKDLPGTLKRLRALGIQNVETAFWPKDVTVKQAAKALKDAGLSVCSSHVDIPVGDKKAAMPEAAEAYGNNRFIWHGWPEDTRYSTLDGTKELIDLYNEAGANAKANGLQFGLHNHWWEYRNKVGGRFVYEWLLEGVSNDIFFEIDTYWVKVAGYDPAAIINKFGNRAKLLHMKDGPAVFNQVMTEGKHDPMMALGEGTQNIGAIANAAKTHIEWMVIEMDVVATDVYQVIKTSYDYLVTNKFAVG